MEEVGELYDQQEYFVPELLMCADALYAGLDILQPHITLEDLGDKPKGQVVIGTVQGDVHDIGKNIIKMMFEVAGFTVHDLKRKIRKLAQGETAGPALGIGVQSFGFKYGLPIDADLVVDVRFLPNPYFQEDLKAQSGKDAAVRDFVLQDATTARFLKKYLDLLDMLIPLYETEGKSNLTIAVGCTGGRHRSVVIAQKIWEHIGNNHYRIRITHRDIDR